MPDKKRTPIQIVLNKRHRFYKSWLMVSDELGGYNKGVLCGVANGKRQPPISLIDLVNKTYTQHIHYPRAPLPNQCWCGKIHQQKRSCNPNARPTPKRDYQAIGAQIYIVI
jgi:hypothetical protein